MKSLALLGPAATRSQAEPFAPTAILTMPSDQAARDAIQQYSPEALLIFGGDGTVNRYLPLIIESQAPVLVVPAGSGNDLARALGTPTIASALELWRSPTRDARFVDLGHAQFADGSSRYFCCCLNLGLDADATQRASAMPRWWRSHGGYAWSGLLEVARFTPLDINLGSEERAEMFPHAWFIAVTNTPTYGGGLKIAPHAKIDDGLLEVCVLKQSPRTALLLNFHRIFRGTHLSLPIIESFQTREVQISAERASVVFGDGELLGYPPVTIRVVSAKAKFFSS